jgi:hypothetical protein
MQTVKVRIAVAVNDLGEWHAYGDDQCGDGDNLAEVEEQMDGPCVCHFVEAEIQVPQVETIKGEVRS